MATTGIAAAVVPASGSATGALGKVRSPVTVILLSIITLGIYAHVWTYKTFQEMRDYSGEGVGGVVGLVIGFLFYGIVIWFVAPSEVGNLHERAGQEKRVQGTTGFWWLLPIIGGIIWVVKVQNALNEFWEARGAVRPA
jgi:Domain of unknown function (DUF4234)